jgi:hypothetical protein
MIMDQRTSDIRVRARLNILRLYPAHRQAALTDRTDFNAWKAKNVAHMTALIESGTDEIDQGWPDPAAHETVAAPKKTNIEKAIDQNGKEEPPEAIADLFKTDRPFAEQALALQRLWVKLGHQVQRGEASPEERHKHERLSSEIEFINKHAFEGV